MKKLLKKKKKVSEDKYEMLFKEVEDLSIKEDYKRLSDALSLNEKRASIPDLIRAIDHVSNNVKLSGYLMVMAKQEQERFRLRFRKAYYEMDMDAREKLSALKNKKKLHGSVTVELVENHIAKYNPEYTRLKKEEIRINTIREAMQIFFEAWRGKMSLLQTQAKLVERRQGISVQEMERGKKK